MRSFILSLPARLHIVLVVGATVVLAFIIAILAGMFFDAEQLRINTDLTAAVYEVMGTVYAILITFTLWGVWQSYTNADNAVQKEAYALLDLVHMVEASPTWLKFNIRAAALSYAEGVRGHEWLLMKDLTSQGINIREHGHPACVNIVHVVQSIVPEGAREIAVFNQALALLSVWMDARRARVLAARGNSAKALWPLLLTGAFVLFAFHGLFVAQTPGIWAALLAGTSLVIGLTFYLIFSLDCPFAGTPSIDAEPFDLAITLLGASSSYGDVLMKSPATEMSLNDI